jgi:integrase
MKTNPLLAEATTWIQAHPVENTEEAYSPYHNEWVTFCADLGVPHFPARPEIVVLYMKKLQERDLRSSTINGVALSAIAADYKLSELSSPTSSPMVSAAKAVIKRIAKPPGKGKLPLPPSMVSQMIEASTDSLIDVRDLFIIILMMAGFLRESEASDLEVLDVWLETHGDIELLYVLVVKSKTDQERRGHTIVIAPALNMLEACPIAFYKKWMKLRDPQAMYLFHQKTSPKKLAHTTPNGIIKKLLKRIHVNPDPYGSHSCRKGGCTEAARKGIAIRILKKHGNWISDAIFTYISESMEERISVSQAVF